MRTAPCGAEVCRGSGKAVGIPGATTHSAVHDSIGPSTATSAPEVAMPIPTPVKVIPAEGCPTTAVAQ